MKPRVQASADSERTPHAGFGRDRSPHAIDKYMDFKTIWTSYR